MEYDILAKVTGFLYSPGSLGKNLSKVARLIVDSFPFDQCAIYLWDEEHRLFRLKALQGVQKGSVETYREKEGIPGLVKKQRAVVEVHTPSQDDVSWEGVEDRGLFGFRSAVVYPLREGHRWHGMVYLKSSKRLNLPARKRRILEFLIFQVSCVLKYNKMFRNLRKAYEELKKMQAQVLIAERLLPLGEMAATLAHEIKNPLISIGGFAGRLARKLPHDSPYMPYVKNILNEVERLDEIMKGIVSISKREEPKFYREDINSIVNESLDFFNEVCRIHDIKMIKRGDREPIYAMVDRAQLRVAFDNLISNAIQSMEKGGILKINTYKKDRWVVVEISDSGGGIEPGVEKNIFNPFFTTKEDGTGLGLAITNTIVKKHGGRIDLKNEIGVGATFSVRLPHHKP